MTTVLNMRAFPVASELFSSLSTRPGSKTSLPIPRSTKSSALLEMLGILVCFIAGLYIAIRLYDCAFGLLDAQLPKAFTACFAAAYMFQLFVGWLEIRAEQRWTEMMRKEQSDSQ
ncbi:uncharacterized protein N0V89_005844 [Didymosphaeria variabile]|uniref:Uncharacterized protein n=1 Tax=Didymosphaeria variabile TaxID=1932322 RepID=A0A9W9CAV3_9PLEO|nr:uncharacterized protein N0V89_005844 [Didymosphaeria variabile]KAJ4354111.1 hypothetical protein N0V89_005844 [Didymosphaeria variabile]